METGRRKLAAPIAAGATAGLVAWLGFKWLLESGPDPSCSEGLEGLGCELGALAGMALMALVLAAGANYAVLRGLGVDRAGQVGTLAVVALAAWFLALDRLFGGFEPRWLALTVPLAAINVLMFAVLERLPQERWITPVLAIGVIVTAWPLHGLSNEVQAVRDDADQTRMIKQADFEIFRPLALDGYEAKDLWLSDWDEVPYAEWWAGTPESPYSVRDSYTVRTFRLPDYFDPPTDCGHDHPYSSGSEACTEVARTDGDEPVYVDGGARFSNVQTYYIPRGNTLITIKTTVPGGLTAPKIVDLVNRLEPAR